MNISEQYAWKVGMGRHNSPLLPQRIRGLIIGKSGCGKTTVIFNLLLQHRWLDYNHLYIFGKKSTPARVQSVEKRTGGWFDQKSNFECV